jgi:hypothetical protein
MEERGKWTRRTRRDRKKGRKRSGEGCLRCIKRAYRVGDQQEQPNKEGEMAEDDRCIVVSKSGQ